MSRNDQLLLLVAVLILVALAVLFPRPAGAGVPSQPSREALIFEPVPALGAAHLRGEPPVSGTPEPSAEMWAARSAGPRGDRTLPSPALQPSSPVASAPATVAPSARLVPKSAPLRLRPAVARAVTGHGSESTTGLASTYGPGFDGYLALPAGPGHRVRICGAGGCVVAVSNDAGPSLAMQRQGRIVDLDVATFERVCGVPWAHGLCRVSVENLP